jgi:hypothetical protein
MPVAKLRQDEMPTPSAAPAAQPSTASTEPETFVATPSPVLTLQQQLLDRAAVTPQADVEKWSPRSSLALIVSASVALWLAILMAGAEVTKLIA